MQLSPLAYSDATLFLAVSAIVLFITVELSSTFYGQTNLMFNKKRLKKVALGTGILFLITMAINIINIIIAS